MPPYIKINKIYIENNNKLEKINAYCDIILLNENMNINYLCCNNLECNNCIINELILKQNKINLNGINQINNLVLFDEININKNTLINNIILNNCNKLDFISNINYKQLFINCDNFYSYYIHLLFKLFQNKIIKSKDELNYKNLNNYKFIELKYTNKSITSDLNYNIINFYFNDNEVYY